MLEIIVLLITAMASSILYRFGGMGKTGKWFDFLCHTKVRDFGVPACAMLALSVLNGILHWSLILCFGAMFGAMTTYWDFINKWLPVKEKDREYWFNWALHGFFIGLSILPFIFFSHQWVAFGLYVLLCSSLMTAVSELSGNVWVEECGRGFIAVASLLVFLLRF